MDEKGKNPPEWREHEGVDSKVYTEKVKFYSLHNLINISAGDVLYVWLMSGAWLDSSRSRDVQTLGFGGRRRCSRPLCRFGTKNLSTQNFRKRLNDSRFG